VPCPSWTEGALLSDRFQAEPVESWAPTYRETLKDFGGRARGLLADLAANIDHYIHAQLEEGGGRLSR
jgi:hypothetical protein